MNVQDTAGKTMFVVIGSIIITLVFHHVQDTMIFLGLTVVFGVPLYYLLGAALVKVQKHRSRI